MVTMGESEGGDSKRREKVARERDRKVEERTGRLSYQYTPESGLTVLCSKHGPSGIEETVVAGPVACAHCEADAAETQDQRLEAMVEDTVEKLSGWILARAHGDDRIEWRQDFANALRDLVKEARRR